jgi:thiol-disulfide isomerase/thioredoxin
MKLFAVIAQTRKKICLILFSFLIFSSVSASELEIKAFIKGSFEQIKQAHKDHPYVISFWSETCGYCMKELALLGKLLKSTPNVTLVSITTDPFLEPQTINRILSQKNLQQVEKWVFSDHNAAPLYYDVDQNWHGELPFTYFFDKNNQMLKHMGTINKKELTDWFAEQRIAP